MAGLGVASTQIMPPIAKLPFIKITAAADMRADALAKFRAQYKGEGYASIEELCASANNFAHIAVISEVAPKAADIRSIVQEKINQQSASV